MSKKLTLLLAGALSALAFTALPSIASANEWECETNPGGAICGSFHGTNNTVTTLTQENGGETVECTGNSLTGEYTTKKTGENLTIDFTGCHPRGNVNGDCHSAGSPAKTIKTFDLDFHNILLEGTVPGPAKLGILITPNTSNGEFATFVCEGVVTVHVKGNGLVGEVTKSCGAETPANTNITLDFESVAEGTQKWTQTETTGTRFDLIAATTFFGTTENTASQDGSGSITFNSATKTTCP
jgi:hypothetical protein